MAKQAIDAKKVAQLANLKLTEDELPRFSEQMEKTISYVEMLNEVTTEDVAPTNQVTGLENITREDKSAPSLTQKEALSNASSTDKGMFKVEAILNE